jgi:hypothetical protein
MKDTMEKKKEFHFFTREVKGKESSDKYFAPIKKNVNLYKSAWLGK